MGISKTLKIRTSKIRTRRRAKNDTLDIEIPK
jgi:hypothetical protein